VTPRRTRGFSPTRVERVTFVIRAENRADLLARVVLLFHRLNLEIDALYMVRRRSSETMRMTVTVEAKPDQAARIAAHLYKVVQVTSVKTERCTDKVLVEALNDSLKT